MSKRAIILGLSFVLFIFIGTYIGAFLVIVDDGEGDPNDTKTEPKEELQFNGSIDRAAVMTEMHRLMNEERKEENLEALGQDADLQEVADYKAQKMVEKEYISHQSPSGETVKDRFEKF